MQVTSGVISPRSELEILQKCWTNTNSNQAARVVVHVKVGSSGKEREVSWTEILGGVGMYNYNPGISESVVHGCPL